MGKCYYAEYYVNLSNKFRVACNNHSLLFTNNPIFADTAAIPPQEIIPANPQVVNYGNRIIADTVNWVKIIGVFVAQGGEQYLPLGNFKYDSQTSFTVTQPSGDYSGLYYVDDVSVYALDSFPLQADAGIDTTIALGDSLFIGSYTNGLTNVKWYNAAGQVIDSVRPGFYVQPTSNTFYILEQTVCGHYSRDTIYISVNPLPLHWLGFTCSAIQNKVASLAWRTANEVNVSRFIIQRSRTGRIFENIADKSAVNTPYNEYLYYDEPPGSGRWYYRLVSIDKDGRKTYSILRSVTFNDKSEVLVIYPNPANNAVNVESNKIKEITLADAAGKKVFYRKFARINNLQIDAGGLPKGLFLITVTNADGIITQKLILE